MNELVTAIDKLIETTASGTPERWRGAAALWMTASPVNREEAAANALYSKKQRESAFNEFGTSGDKNSRLRSPIGMPQGMLVTIEASDPDSFIDQSKIKNVYRKMAKVFPEFATVEKV